MLCVAMLSVIFMSVIMPSFVCYLMFFQMSVFCVSLCKCHNAEGWVLFIVILNAFFLNVVILSVIMLNFIILSVIMLNVIMLTVIMMIVMV
jgi:hypothetical protein